MESVNADLTKLQTPFTLIVSGPSSCGKTELIFKILDNVDDVLTPRVDEIIYCYGQWQPSFARFQKKVRFNQGLLSREELLTDPRDPKKKTLLIIDDLIDSENLPLIKDLFVKGSHHRNISVIFVTQNLYLPDNDYRTASRNAHYMVLFKNPRDMGQVMTLSRQIYPSNPSFLTKVYTKETAEPHSYIVVDFKQSTPDRLRIRDSITSPEGTAVFVPK